MRDLSKMRRVLWGHTFDGPDEWASALRRLADLSDEQISRLPGTPSSAKVSPSTPTRPADERDDRG